MRRLDHGLLEVLVDLWRDRSREIGRDVIVVEFDDVSADEGIADREEGAHEPIEVGGVGDLIHFLRRGIKGFDDDERAPFGRR